MKRNPNPDWYKLTKLLKEKKKINTGLTIPYLFGAYELLGKPLEDIPALLAELRKYQIDKYPVIQKCAVIGQHVIAVEAKNGYHKDYLKDLKLRNANNEIDLIVSSNTDLGKNYEMLCKNLIQLYKKCVDDNTFSWNNKEQVWKAFDKEETELILSIRQKSS